MTPLPPRRSWFAVWRWPRWVWGLNGQIYSVNDVIASLERFRGRTVQIACILHLEFEGDSIWHVPTDEQLPEYGSSLWANFDFESLGCLPRDLELHDGCQVIVTATVTDGQGHFDLWPGSVTIHSIVRPNRQADN